MKIQKISAFILAIAIVGILPVGIANAAVWTSQSDYSPGSTVIISGNNSDGAGYVASETVNINITGPYGSEQGSTIVGDDSSFSWQFILPSDDSAAGDYSYTVIGEQSGVIQSGSFTDKVDTITALDTISTPLTAGQISVAFSGQVTKKSGSIAPTGNVELRYSSECLQGSFGNSLATAGASGSYSGTFTAPAVGSYNFWAYYVGNSGHNSSSSACQPITVNAIPTKSDQTITFGSLSDKTYGDVDFNVSATASSGLTVTFTVSGDCSVTGILVHITSAGNCTITAHQAGDSSYNPAPDVPQSFNIVKATPVITWANPADITYPAPLSGTQLNATADVAGSFIYTPAADTVLNAGAGQALHVDFTPTDITNYNTAFKDVTINVLKANQTITVTIPAPANATYNNSFTVAATASSGLTVTYSSSGVCSNIGATFTMTSGTGICTVHYNQAGDTNYNAAPEVTSDTTAQKADATIDVHGYTGVYDGDAHGASDTVTGVKGEDLSGSLNLGAKYTDVPGGTADWTFTGGTNYNDASGHVAIDISKADATIVVTSYDVTYDGDSHIAGGSAKGVKDELLSGLDLTGTTHTDAGTYSSDPWTFTDVTGNYNDKSGTVDDNIVRANAIIIVTGYTGTYDGSAHGASGTATGVKSEDLSSLLHLGSTFTNFPGGTADWTFDGDINYNSDSNSVAIVINKADPTIVVTPYNVDYDGNPHTATGSAKGVLVEDLNGLNLSGTTHTNAGVYTGDAWTFTDVTGNYNDKSGTVDDKIAKADQTINFGPLGNKVFGSPDFSLSANASSGLTVAFNSNTPLVCTVTDTTVHLLGKVDNVCSITASQAGDGNYNAATPVTQTFKILSYGVTTKLPPITIVKKDFQKSSTIPVKFTIYNGSTFISWAHATLFVDSTSTPAVSSGNSNSGNNFRYADKLYIFNLSTKMPIFNKGTSYTLMINLDDGETIIQLITIK